MKHSFLVLQFISNSNHTTCTVYSHLDKVSIRISNQRIRNPRGTYENDGDDIEYDDSVCLTICLVVQITASLKSRIRKTWWNRMCDAELPCRYCSLFSGNYAFITTISFIPVSRTISNCRTILQVNRYYIESGLSSLTSLTIHFFNQWLENDGNLMKTEMTMIKKLT